MLSYVSVTDLAVFLDVTVASLRLAHANLALAAAQQSVRMFMDQEITYHANDVVYLDGNGKTKIRLPERPVRAVTLVEEAEGDPTWTTVDADAYLVKTSPRLQSTILVRWDGSPWRFGESNYRVTYSHGWYVGSVDSDISDSDFDTELGSLPADISLVTLSAARRAYDRLGEEAAAGDVKQETIGSYSYTLATEAEKSGGVELLTAEKGVLSRYRFEGAG